MLYFRLFFLLLVVLASPPLHAATFRAEGDIIGEVSYHRVSYGENLYQIARAYDLGIVELMAANPGVDVWIPDTGSHVALPMAHVLPPVRSGLVLNLAELRLFYFTPEGTVMTFPITIGKEGWGTPVGTTTIRDKRRHPAWYVPPSIRAEDPSLPSYIAPGPDNPLGDYALNLGWSGFRIHGTNRPASIGRRGSHGCIRLYPEDIEQLFNVVATGTKVTVVDMPYKVGWRGDTLFLEVSPTQAQSDAILLERAPLPVSGAGLNAMILRMAGQQARIDWKKVETALARHDGIVVAIASTAPRSMFFWR